MGHFLEENDRVAVIEFESEKGPFKMATEDCWIFVAILMTSARVIWRIWGTQKAFRGNQCGEVSGSRPYLFANFANLVSPRKRIRFSIGLMMAEWRGNGH